MIVYNDIKRQFVNDVKDNSIANKILEAIKMRGLNAGHEKEYSSWQNSKGKLTWVINPNSFEEIGCIHTAQGLEFDYVGVFTGKGLTHNPVTRSIETHRDAISNDDKSSGIRSAAPAKAHQLILNTYKTLLTRGQKGCYVYCEDPELRKFIKSKL